MRKFSHWLAGLALIAAILACNLPSAQQTPAAVMTAAALTIQAQISPTAASPTATLTPAGFPTLPPATDTAPAAATTPCDIAQFITDVTVPDNTVMTQNQSFTKTWRLKNVGTCSWTSSYAVIFFSGDSMNGPAVQALSGNVNPGQTVDISVDLKAPGSNGTYTGYWKLRNAAGVAFAQFYVKIKVQGGGGGGGTHTVDLPYLAGESGLVLSGGAVNPLTVAAGDSSSNQRVEAFLSFDISAIPAGSTIQTASIKLKGGSQVRGNPFATLGCLRAYTQDFGTVDAGDFVSGAVSGAIRRWCSAAELTDASNDADFVSGVQSAVGKSRLQIRLEFNQTQTDGDGTIDDVLILAPVTVTIKYLAP